MPTAREKYCIGNEEMADCPRSRQRRLKMDPAYPGTAPSRISPGPCTRTWGQGAASSGSFALPSYSCGAHFPVASSGELAVSVFTTGFLIWTQCLLLSSPFSSLNSPERNLLQTPLIWAGSILPRFPMGSPVFTVIA